VIHFPSAIREERVRLLQALDAPDRVAALERWLEGARLRHGETSPALLALRPGDWKVLIDGLRGRNLPLLRETLGFAHLWVPQAMYVAYPELGEYARLLQSAGWGPPPGLPPIVSIWRGGRAKTVDELRLGRSWTLRRSVACGFAIDRRLRGATGDTMVLRAEVPRETIAAYVDPVTMLEIVLHAPPSTVGIDGSESDWIMAAAQEQYRLGAIIRQQSAAAPLAFRGFLAHVFDAVPPGWSPT
jgi:hypothetical protein